MVDLLPVTSDMVASLGYDTERSVLYVLFNTGKAYEYHNVPPEEYQALLSAESKGTYMRTHIINHYDYSLFKGWK
ncbi:MAG: KTSC domain-containing protein [Omnitrophica WOR_2 bacterium]